MFTCEALCIIRDFGAHAITYLPSFRLRLNNNIGGKGKDEKGKGRKGKGGEKMIRKTFLVCLEEKIHFIFLLLKRFIVNKVKELNLLISLPSKSLPSKIVIQTKENTSL